MVLPFLRLSRFATPANLRSPAKPAVAMDQSGETPRSVQSECIAATHPEVQMAMLRFDVPQVCSNVTRWEAFVTFVICWVALLVSPWAMALPVLQGAVRGFVGHHRCPSHRLWSYLALRGGWQGRRENAGAKLFASKVLFVASAASLIRFMAGSPLWRVPCVALILFSLLEWAAEFCAACWVYGAWYRRVPPAGT
jgi:hypothetical protein